MTSRQVKAFTRNLDDIAHIVGQLQKDAPELVERSLMRAGADGYPRQSMGGGGGSDPTEGGSTAAAALASYKVRTDDEGEPVGEGEWTSGMDQVRDRCERLTANVEAALSRLERAVIELHDAKRLQASPGRHSNMPERCKACTRLVMCTAADPIRSGYCGACDTAWRRWKANEGATEVAADPGRARRLFEVWRREQLQDAS